MIKTDFNRLTKTKHMLEWLASKPYEAIISTIEEMYIKQSPTTKILEFKIMSDPEWLTGVRKSNESDKVILVRTGLAVSCDFTLEDKNGTYNLNGILTWVGTKLDNKPITRMWMDLDGDIEKFGKNGLLAERIYELDS